MMPGLLAAQQSGGQFCVRAFEDQNGNGQREANEPVLTRGLSVNLLDSKNVTIASALLDQSPTAAQGIVCFVNLATGQYTINVTSADYNATTPTSLTTTINADALPTVIDYGGRPTISGEATQPSTAAPPAQVDQNQLLRIFISGLGALVVIAGMAVLGSLVFLLAFRRRTPADRRRTTGSTPVVKTGETGKTPKVQ
jgi:hypothetical protein